MSSDDLSWTIIVCVFIIGYVAVKITRIITKTELP